MERLWIIGQPRKHTIVLGGSQFTRYIPLSKTEAKIKNQAGFFCVRQVYFTTTSWRQIWWRVNQPFNTLFFILSEVGTEYYEVLFFCHTDLGQNLFIFAFFKPIILQFFTVLQDKLNSFNIQDDRVTRFLSPQTMALTTL